MLERVRAIFGGGSASPPVHHSFAISAGEDEPAAEIGTPAAGQELQVIAGFTCVIDYADANGEASERLITCRTYEVRNGRASVCAICHVRNAYRRFIVDRIEAVYDAVTGELLGTAKFFERFAPDVDTKGAPTWGLTSSRKQTLIAGLNILAFMARCDGEWHPLEEPVFSDFVDRFWIAKGWPDEPPMCSIMDHARNLAPDSETFFKAIEAYARSTTSTQLILDATTELIQADGIIVREEVDWTVAMLDAFREAKGQ